MGDKQIVDKLSEIVQYSLPEEAALRLVVLPTVPQLLEAFYDVRYSCLRNILVDGYLTDGTFLFSIARNIKDIDPIRTQIPTIALNSESGWEYSKPLRGPSTFIKL